MIFYYPDFCKKKILVLNSSSTRKLGERAHINVWVQAIGLLQRFNAQRSAKNRPFKMFSTDNGFVKFAIYYLQ